MKNIVNRLDEMCEQACLATTRDEYITELYGTIKDCNDRNSAPFSNENIWYEISGVIVEEEAEAHNVTAETFCKMPVTPNTQGENKNAILTSERLNNLDALAYTLKLLTINNAEYYESDKICAKGDLASYPKVDTHTSDWKKRKVTDTSNKNLQQKLLSNWTLPIITTTIEPWISDRIATCGGTPHVLPTHTTKGVITDAARSSPLFLRTPGYVRKTGRYGTTPRNGDFVVGSPWDNRPFMIGVIISPPTMGNSASQEIIKKRQST